MILQFRRCDTAGNEMQNQRAGMAVRVAQTTTREKKSEQEGAEPYRQWRVGIERGMLVAGA